MKRCDVCKFWIPRTDIGYCKKQGTEDVECNDCCDLFIGTEQKLDTRSFLRKFSKEMEKSEKPK